MGLRVEIAGAAAHFMRKCVLFLWPGSRCSRSRFWGRSSSCDDETERERTAKRMGKMVSSALSSPATPSHTSQPRADWAWCFCSSCSARTLPTKAMRRPRLGVSACSKKSRKRAAARRARPRPRTQHRARNAPILAAAACSRVAVAHAAPLSPRKTPRAAFGHWIAGLSMAAKLVELCLEKDEVEVRQRALCTFPQQPRGRVLSISMGYLVCVAVRVI